MTTVPATLTCTFLSYPTVRVSYPIVRVSYQVFRLSYRETRLSGFAFIVYQVLRLSCESGIPRHFQEQINEKPRNLQHFLLLSGY